MDFVRNVPEIWDDFLCILLIKPDHSNYFKLNSIVVAGRIKDRDLHERFQWLSVQD